MTQQNRETLTGVVNGHIAGSVTSPTKLFFRLPGQDKDVGLNMWRDKETKAENPVFLSLIQEYGDMKNLEGYEATVEVVKGSDYVKNGVFQSYQYTLYSLVRGEHVGKSTPSRQPSTQRFASYSEDRPSTAAGDRVEGIRLGGTRTGAFGHAGIWAQYWLSIQTGPVTREQYMDEVVITARELTPRLFDIDAVPKSSASEPIDDPFEVQDRFKE
jgi:hypothetical protein